MLARVPWLAPAPVAEPQPPQLDATIFQPHSVVAMPDLGVADYTDRTPKYRFDPPQPKAESLESHHAPQAKAEPAGESNTRTIEAPVASPSTESTPQTTPGPMHLRFDPAEGTTVDATPAAEPKLVATREPSDWHYAVAAVDTAIRKYHRLIVLAALFTAAGLMLLMLQGKPTTADTQPSEAETKAEHVASQPEWMDMTQIPRLETFEEDTPGEELAEARGPQSHSRLRTTAPVEPEVIDQLPLAPHREPLTTEVAQRDDLRPIGMAGPTDSPDSLYPTTQPSDFSLSATEPSAEANRIEPPVRLSQKLQPVEAPRRQ